MLCSSFLRVDFLLPAGHVTAYEAAFSREATLDGPERLLPGPQHFKFTEHHHSLTSVDAVSLDLPSVRYRSTTLGLTVSHLHILISTHLTKMPLVCDFKLNLCRPVRVSCNVCFLQRTSQRTHTDIVSLNKT